MARTGVLKKNLIDRNYFRAFSHDVKAAMLVFQTNPVGVELFPCVNISFIAKHLHR